MRRLKGLAATFGMAAIVALCLSVPSSSQQQFRGTITGSVTTDRGDVIGLRVAVHNLDSKLWYTVFTNKGRYTVPQALPGRYEVRVDEPAFASPTIPLKLASGETKTVDIALKSQSLEVWKKTNGDGNLDHMRRARPPAEKPAGPVVIVDSLEALFPPGPGLDLLKQHCTGCHGGGWGALHYTKAQFLKAIEGEFETGRNLNKTPFSKSQKELLADYLVKNFGPGVPERQLRVDPFVPDESVVSKQIYVSYDIPADTPFAPGTINARKANMIDGEDPGPGAPYNVHHLQAVFLSPVDGNLFVTCGSCNSLLRLRPKEFDAGERWKNIPIKGPNPHVQPSGIAIDQRGHVFWSEDITGGLFGELDPVTGKQIRYRLPFEGGMMHEVIVDKEGNVGFGLIQGAEFGRMDVKTHEIHMYPTPTPDNGLYGLAFDQKGNMWGCGWEKGTINKWDRETESVKEYKVPSSWGAVRRCTVDSKGIVWAGGYNSGILTRFDPVTERITDEYKVPLSGVNLYDTWTDKSDNVWMTDQLHGVLIKFDQHTTTFAFYPMSQPHQSVPKLHMADDGTIWFGTRGKSVAVAVHFYPEGYTASAPPAP